LSPITRLIFPEADDAHLEKQEEDGVAVEPRHFLPVVPAILLNGSAGIGTGWSTSIPTFNPLRVTDAVRRRLDTLQGTNPAPMTTGKASRKKSVAVAAVAVDAPLTPWVRGFKGTYTELNKDSVETVGTATIKKNVIEVSQCVKFIVTLTIIIRIFIDLQLVVL
jgi:DNA topoisomerase-2